MFLSAALMLDWLSQRHGEPALAQGARAIEGALEHVLATKAAVPMEHGGDAGTAAMTRAVVAALREVVPA